MSAIFSDDRVYRYRLLRYLKPGPSLCTFVMLNPSTADETVDDPTIRRCMGYAKSWGFSQLAVVNLFAYRATNPKDMKAVRDPIGPENDMYLEEAATLADLVVCAWGEHGTYRGRSGEVRQMLMSAGVPLTALRLSKSGQPMHPLYLPGDLKAAPL